MSEFDRGGPPDNHPGPMHDPAETSYGLDERPFYDAPDARPSTEPPPRKKEYPDPTIEELIERSSLGTPGAKALRARTPPEVAEAIVARAETAYRPPVQPPSGWEGRTPKHFAASDKATIPSALGVKVVGLSFVPKYPRNLHALASLAESETPPPMILRRNPDNPHDANAVEVLAVRASGVPSMIGHLPAALAARIAPELDAGAEWTVTRYEVLEMPGHENKPGISIDLRRRDD